MTRKEVTKQIREARRADRMRYDDVTRRMLERIEELRRQSESRARRESS
jgi:hypothetical protein